MGVKRSSPMVQGKGERPTTLARRKKEEEGGMGPADEEKQIPSSKENIRTRYFRRQKKRRGTGGNQGTGGPLQSLFQWEKGGGGGGFLFSLSGGKGGVIRSQKPACQRGEHSVNSLAGRTGETLLRLPPDNDETSHPTFVR